jgi:biotin carboxyl carrier protein
MYKVIVNSNFSFDFSEEDITASDTIKTSGNNYHILKEDASIEASVTQVSFLTKTYTVMVNNNSYEVIIQDALDQQINAMGFEIGASKQINEIKAPMPGLILEISVAVGTEVEENDPLLILEAMKMENVISSPRSGIIKSIAVNQGETVDKNSLLIAFE